jgi:hypothetical protein
MPGDYSRKTFRRRKHYSGVLMQQGRVQLDSDWNEQLDIQLHRTETEAVDVIGPSGVPKGVPTSDGGFKIGATASGHDLSISAGRIYVEGLLCELDQPATYTHQPHFPNPDFTAPSSSPPSSPPGPLQMTLSDGPYLVFLDAWQREITARDDRLIREVALGGPDTAARLQTVYQVKLLDLPLASPPGAVNCQTALPAFDQYTALTTGTLNARTQPPQGQPNPCLLPPTAGYNRLENQLYRVEIHRGGPLNQATFKWSRDNASIETTVENVAGNAVTVSDIGRDEVLGLAGQQWVEILDEESTLKSAPHDLAQIDKIDPARREVTLKTSAMSYANLPGLKLRRWDQTGATATATGVSASLANWIELEGGIQVRFSAGLYHAGDYWLIPARTATSEIEWPPYATPNTNPIPQPPRGIRHHYCRLAIVDVIGGIVSIREDCRKRFPALTEICAEDVCFDNNNCKLGAADTVQEALDLLCAERDLRFHNKHLHGWGIVCGLQVECGPGPRSVTVRKGYAIDCEGADVIVDRDEPVDVLELIASSGLFPVASPPASPPGIPDTDACLVLDSTPGRTGRYRVEPYPAGKGTLQSLFKGTLLLDVFNDCIKSLVDLVLAEFTPAPGDENLPVSPALKRLITFLNLIVELWDSVNGPFVFLSGEKGQSGKNLEDTILRDFYTKLRAKLQSHTFCAMFDGARPFPEYPYSGSGITTIFGKGFQTRLRVSPDEKAAYTVGASNKINLFDLAKGEMVAELAPPFPGGAIVQDVAFSGDGKELYAVATLGNKDSFFVVADVNGLVHTFRNPSTICDVQLVTLATRPSTPSSVYGIGKGRGLYEIDPANAGNTTANTPKNGFNASGHLIINEALGQAFATANAAGATTDRYDRVRRVNLSGNPSPVEFLTKAIVQGTTIATPGEDDIALAVNGSAKLYVVSGLSSSTFNKQAVVFNAADQSTNPPSVAVVDLGENTTIRLAHDRITKHMMVTYEDSYRVGLISPNDTLVANYRQPVQISPVSIAASPRGLGVWVLNFTSNTITSIAHGLQPSSQLPLQPLVDYRAGVLNAYADLLGGLLQYLKDCFCDHLLVNCPTCGPDDKLYLACITVKNGKVFKVCNFSHRKYVHSFPTWEYWLSIVPVLPVIKKIVEEICCAALPAVFRKYNAPQPQVPAAAVGGGATGTVSTGGAIIGAGAVLGTMLKGAPLRRGVTVLQQADFKGAVRERVTKFTSAGELFRAFAATTTDKLLVAPPRTVAPTDIIGRNVDDAKKKLADAGVIATVEPFDPERGAANVLDFSAAPVRLEPNARVRLVTRDEKVLFYARAPEPLPQVAALQAAIDANKEEIARTAPEITDLKARLDSSANEASQLRTEVNTLKTELLETRRAHEQDLAARDTQIAELQAGARELKTNIQAVKDLKKQVEKLRGPHG